MHGVVRKGWTLYTVGREVHYLKPSRQPTPPTPSELPAQPETPEGYHLRSPAVELSDVVDTPAMETPASPVLVAVEAKPAASEQSVDTTVDPPPANTPVEEGEWVDAICTKYEPFFGDGMLKIERRFRTPTRYWLSFRVADIVSEGRIHVNSLVHCLVGEPDYAGTCPRARQISLYKDVE